VKRLIGLVAAAGLLAGAPAASAAVKLDGGSTALTLDKGTARALAGLGVKVSPTGAARLRGRRATFPITGGAIDPATAAGTIRHRGGLRLKAGGTAVVLKDYRVTVGRQINLSAKVGGARLHILKLRGTPKVSRAGFDTRVRGLTARLTGKAAHALNRAFGVHAFRRGLPLGRVAVNAKPAQTELLATGATALAIDPGALSALASQGITPGIVGPATLSGTTASFPVAGGKVNLDLSAGVVRHAGGISLTKGATVVRLTDFDVRVGATPQLFAAVTGGATKVAALDLDLTGVTPAVDGRTITVSGVTARLTQGAADALNAAFATSAFTAGLVLGQATVSATGK
jgi:hypothetical protein